MINNDPNKTLVELFDDLENAQNEADKLDNEANRARTAHANAEIKVEQAANKIYEILMKRSNHLRERHSRGWYKSKLGQMLAREKDRENQHVLITCDEMTEGIQQ